MIFIEFDTEYDNAQMTIPRDTYSPWLFMYAVLRKNVPKAYVSTISYKDLEEMPHHKRYVAMDEALTFIGIAYVDEETKKRRLRTVVDGKICEQKVLRKEYQVWDIYTYQSHSAQMIDLGLDTIHYRPSLNSDSNDII